MNLSFIKLDINILDDNKIKILRKYPDGDKLIILWIGLLCLAMKSDNPGYIYVTNNIPFTEKDLSIILDIEEKTIQMGLKLFEEYNMIDIINGGIIEIINFNKHQNLDKIEHEKERSRLSSQKYREKQKLLLGDGHVMKSDETDIDIDKELDKDKEKKKEEERQKVILLELVIDCLNEITGKKFTYKNKSYNSHIMARINEGYKYCDFEKVIETKANDYYFKKNPQYMNPDTLFRISNFEKYLNETGEKNVD